MCRRRRYECNREDGRPGYDEDEHANCCERCCQRCCTWRSCKNHILVLLILLAVAAGTGLGLYLRTRWPFNQPKHHPKMLMYLNFPGELFLRIMTFLSVPLIVSSLISGVATLDVKTSGKVGVWAFMYYILTTILAVCEGFGFVFAIRPTSNIELEDDEYKGSVNGIDALLDMFRNIFPDNFLGPNFYLTQSEAVTRVISVLNVTNKSLLVDDVNVGQTQGVNILGLTVCCITFGLVFSSMGRQARIMVEIFNILYQATMKLVQKLLWLYPIGVFFLVCSTVVRLDNPVDHILSMGWFLLTVLAGLATHFLIILPLVFLIFARRNPIRHMCGCLRAILTAFATNNSQVTLPVTMDCLENQLKINPRVTRFMCPVGATINMDGFALYEAVAVIYIALLRGMNPGATDIISLGFTAVAVSIGAPTAGSGMVLYAILFQTIGLPLDDVAILVPFDWILGRLRTMTNVWGDCVGAGIISHAAGDELDCQLYQEPLLPEYEGVNHPQNGCPKETYTPKKEYTVTMRNETGDLMKVSRI